MTPARLLLKPFKKTTRRLSLLVLLCLLSLLAACDPGSTIDIALQDDNTCAVSMRNNANGFTVAMDLACDANGENCYEITALSCQGVAKPDAVPIDLVAAGDCPPVDGQGDWCIASCDAGLDAPGLLWDMPSLLAVEGCNTYEN